MPNKTIDYYNKNARRWAELKTNSFYHEEPFRIFEKLLDNKARVLDIGCAYGIHVPLFLGIGRKLQYKGIDVSGSMIKIARSRYPQISFKLADALNFKSDKKFDAFWSAATLMHVPIKNWPKLLDNIRNNMKSGAIGYLTLPSTRPNPASSEDQRHFELLDENTFKDTTQNMNWTIVKSGILPSGADHIWFWYIVRLP